MVNIGALTGGASVLITIKAIDEYSAQLNKANGGFRDFSKTMTLAGTAITGFGIASVLALRSFVDEAARFEQTRVAFTTLLGDAKEAQRFLGDLSEFAARTPFTLPGVEKSARQLLAVGFNAQEILPTLKSVGDIASGLGLGEEGLQRLILNLGQVRTQGKLTGRELRDFAVAGVPLLQELSKELGVSTEKVRELISKGKIDSDIVTKTFRNMTSEGGKFANLMSKQALTTEGRISNLKDSFILLKRELGEELLPVANVIVTIMKDVLDTFNNLDDGIKTTIIVVAALTTTFMLIVGPLLLFLGLLPTLSAGLGILTTSLGFATAGTTALGGAAFLTSGAFLGPLGLITALTTVMALDYLNHQKNIENMAGSYDTLGVSVNGASDGLQRFKDLTEDIRFLQTGTRMTEPIPQDRFKVDFEKFFAEQNKDIVNEVVNEIKKPENNIIQVEPGGSFRMSNPSNTINLNIGGDVVGLTPQQLMDSLNKQFSEKLNEQVSL